MDESIDTKAIKVLDKEQNASLSDLIIQKSEIDKENGREQT